MAKLPLVRGQISRKELGDLLGREVAVGSPLEELHEVRTNVPDTVARFECWSRAMPSCTSVPNNI
jgi:hypothetical protein